VCRDSITGELVSATPELVNRCVTTQLQVSSLASHLSSLTGVSCRDSITGELVSDTPDLIKRCVTTQSHVSINTVFAVQFTLLRNAILCLCRRAHFDCSCFHAILPWRLYWALQILIWEPTSESGGLMIEDSVCNCALTKCAVSALVQYKGLITGTLDHCLCMWYMK